MDAWSALLVPHPNPHFFKGNKSLDRLPAPSSSDSRSSFMSLLPNGMQKQGKPMRTHDTYCPPPVIQPLSFEHEPMLDMTPNVFDFFHDNVHPFTSNSNWALDGNLVSQPKGRTQSPSSHLPHPIITGVSQSISPTVVNSNSSLAVPMFSSSNAIDTATGQLGSNSPFFSNLFCSNPLGYISRKFTKRRHSTRMPRSASSALILSEATLTTNNISTTAITPPDSTSSKLIPSLPPLIPAIAPVTNGLPPVTRVTDDPILASSTVPPQHAPQSTVECSRFQAENARPAPTHLPPSNFAYSVVHMSEISAANEPPARLSNAVHLHQSESASIIPAGMAEAAAEWALGTQEDTDERGFFSEHIPVSGSSNSFEPLTSYVRESNLETTERSEPTYHTQEFEAISVAAGPNGADKDLEEHSNQYQYLFLDRVPDDGREDDDSLLPSTLNHSISPISPLQHSHSQDQSRDCISVSPPPPSTPPMLSSTSSSHSHRWSSSGCSRELHGRDRAPSISTLDEEAAICGGIAVADVLATHDVTFEGGKPVGSGLMSFANWKWKKGWRSIYEEETAANNRSETGITQGVEPSTVRRDGDSPARGRPHSPKVYCEASQLITSTPTDNSAITITQVTAATSMSSPHHSESGRTCPAETTIVAVMDVDNTQRSFKSIRNKPKPKFTIGDLEGVEFPVGYSNTEVHDEPERAALDLSNAALRVCLVRQDARNEGNHRAGRRWTLASAMTDEKISHDGLVKVLDRIRDDSVGEEGGDGFELVTMNMEKEILEGWGTGMPDAGGADWLRDDTRLMLDESTERADAGFSESPVDEYGSYLSQTRVARTTNKHIRSRSTPSPALLAAQRAFFACRELILTERHYIAKLLALVQQQTATLPPPLMCDRAKELLHASECVLKGMEKDPSARGVASAFLEVEEQVQGAYVRWCGLVGAWFSGDGSSQDDSAPVGRPSLDLSEVGNLVRNFSVKTRNKIGSKTDADKQASSVKGSEEEDASMTPLKRTVSTWRKSMPTLGFDTPPLYGGGDRKKDKESEREVTPARKPDIRELAILPTQRVMRYDMLYHELLQHTPPTSPSRISVERAAQAAARIAQQCNLAQENAAFIVSPPPNTNGGVSRTRSSSRTDGQVFPSRVPPLPTTFVATEPLAYHSVPASPTSMVDSTSRSSTQFQSANYKSGTDFMPGHRRLSSSIMSLGRGRGTKQKVPATPEVCR